MDRIFHIVYAVCLAAALLYSRMKGWGVRRHGRWIRIVSWSAMESVLVFSAVSAHPLSAALVSVDFLAAALSVLLLPVPPSRRLRLPVLDVLPLPVLPLSLFFPHPAGYAGYLLLLLFVCRVIQGRRRLRQMDANIRVCTYRRCLQQIDRDNYAFLWSSLLLAVLLLGPYPRLSTALSVPVMLFYVLADLRWASGSVFFLVPDVELELSRLAIRQGRGRLTDPPTFDRSLYERCCRYMTERRPFLVESFSLNDLAGAMYTNKAYLSKTINEYARKNFRSWVNHYRVQYSMDLFRRNMSLRVFDLANLSGFHSVTTFNMAFKAIMEESPSTWCRRVRYRPSAGKTLPVPD